MTPYEDIQCLRNTGLWPNGRIPKWAEEKAQQLQCIPTNSAVIEYGLELEIQRLKRTSRIVQGDSNDVDYPDIPPYCF